jgi:hypothetical protein
MGLNKYTYVYNNPLLCAPNGLKPGQVGIWLASFISTKTVNAAGAPSFGRGDSRGTQCDGGTSRLEIRMAVDVKAGTVTKTDEAGSQMKNEMKFLLTGLIGGLTCVAPAPSFMLLTLTWGVGPAFFVAVVVGIILTGGRRDLQANVLQYMAGLVVYIITYLLALIVFVLVTGYSSEWFGFRQADFAKFELVSIFSLIFSPLRHAPRVELLSLPLF